MAGVKIVLLTASLVLLVSAAPSPMTESQSSDVGSVFELDESQVSQQQREARLNDE